MKVTKRWATLAGSLALAACSGDPETDTSTAQHSLSAGRFQRTNFSGSLKANVKPQRLDTSLITVVAKMASPPVTLVQEAAGYKLTGSEKIRARTQNLQEQAALLPQIAAIGGKVVGAYQYVLNGVRVEIPRNRLDALRNLPGVVGIKEVALYERLHAVSVPRIQAPAVWAGVFGLRGEGVKVAVIDSGIDYTHANFGGPGTPAAFAAADAKDTLPADATLFGPGAPKVKGGIDLAGDNYTGGSASPPAPDSNPLDCAADDGGGHGSHTAGSVAGFGVLKTGATYSGPYDASIYASNDFKIAPGVAPKADLYAVRVFGCQGGTRLVTEALEWAVANDMDVVNMSIGSSFGTEDDASAEAADNAVKSGVIVVASAGNAGNVRYVTGSPGSSTHAISVAASVRRANYPMVDVALPDVSGSGTRTIRVQNSNDATLPSAALEVKVLRNADGTVSLGCKSTDYTGVTGKLVVVARGTCARVARPIYAEQAGAAALAMINNQAGLPPFEGKITENPDDGKPFNVTIPFLGVENTLADPKSDGNALMARDGVKVTLAVGAPLKTGMADFSSSGPRNGDSILKPDITAPGEDIVSTLSGTGTEGVAFSGTSMSAPHIAGVAALTLQAHPKWTPYQIKAAIINSGDPSVLAGYATNQAGSGLVNAANAARTSVIAYSDTAAVSINYGLVEFQDDFRKTKTIYLRNDGTTEAAFSLASVFPQGSKHSVSWSSSRVTVPAKGQATVDITLTISAATAGNSDAFREVAGLLELTPIAGANHNVSLRLPYYAVPRVSAAIQTQVSGKLVGKPPVGSAVVSNLGSQIAATADFFAWGLSKASTPDLGAVNLRAAGVQKLDDVGCFAVNTHKAWSTPADLELDVLVDTNGDNDPEFVIFNIDESAVTGLGFADKPVTIVYDLKTMTFTANYYALTSTDTSTMLLPFDFKDLGLTTASPRFWYSVESFEGVNHDEIPSFAPFNSDKPAISTGQFLKLAPNAQELAALSINPVEWVTTPALGLMVVSLDNKNGAAEAQLLKVKF